jgi:hypothetical protein
MENPSGPRALSAPRCHIASKISDSEIGWVRFSIVFICDNGREYAQA